jgi:transcriptional regulator with XRE-family HTH domain
MPRPKRLEPIPVAITDVYIGKLITQRRTELGLTQAQLAKNMGLIQSLISAYERGILRMTVEMLVRFAQVLNVPVQYFLSADKPNPETKFSFKITKRMAGIAKLSAQTQRHLLRVIDIYINSETSDEQNDSTPEAKEEELNNALRPLRKQHSLEKREPASLAWTYEDHEMLKMYYPRLGKKEILELFPKRSWSECCAEAESMGIKRLVDDFEIYRYAAKHRKKGDPRGPTYSWTEEDRRIVRNLYPSAPKTDILSKLKHRTWHSIQKEASRQKIKRDIRDLDEEY